MCNAIASAYAPVIRQQSRRLVLMQQYCGLTCVLASFAGTLPKSTVPLRHHSSPGRLTTSAAPEQQQRQDVALPVGQRRQAGHGAPGPLAVVLGQLVIMTATGTLRADTHSPARLPRLLACGVCRGRAILITPRETPGYHKP
jgi:hypothetical protein